MKYQCMMGECIRVLLVGSGLLAYVHGHNYLDLKKTRGSFTATTYFERTIC